MQPITISNLTITGRINANAPNNSKMFITYNADFSASADVSLDFTVVNQQQVFGIPKSVFLDNGRNPSEVEVYVTGTDQYFTVPPYAQGVFTINAAESSLLRFITDGGATDIVTITIYNYLVPPSVWYSFGAFNNNKPVMCEGTMDPGDTVAASLNNKPVFMGGIDYATGLFQAVSVNSLGQVGIDNLNVTIGGVYGAETLGAAPVNPGVLTAVLDSAGNVSNLALNAAGEILVKDGTADTALTGINTKLAAPTVGTVTVVASVITDATILASNANRKGAIIYNNSNSALNLALSNVDATVTYSVQVAAGASFVLSAGDYTGVIKGTWVAANGQANVTEFA